MTRVCIPIIAKTVEQAVIELKEAEKLTDLIELRIDFIKDIDKEKLSTLLKERKKEVIVTCRNVDSGGHFDGTENQRIELFNHAINENSDFIDIEIESDKKHISNIIKNKKNTKVILSHHNFKKTPSLKILKNIYKEANSLSPDLIKIVTMANSINDCFTIFDLLKGKTNLISLCMGIRGYISRILAAKYGAYISYACLQKGKESALGQISAEFMEKTYNFSLLNKNTKVLGVMGEHAENSKSKFMHNVNFRQKKLNYIYVPFKVRKVELKEFMNNFRKFKFRGSAVTVPHKQEVVQYIDNLDDTAKQIGATNTLVNIDNFITGYNTDYYGAIMALKEKTEVKGKKVLVIGAGGGARAVIYSLKKENAKITIINRTFEKAKRLAKRFSIEYERIENIKNLIVKNDIIINTTSVGMSPNDKKSIVREEDISENNIIMDIVYTPVETEFIKQAKRRNCKTITGDRIIFYQALGQFNAWTGIEPDYDLMQQSLMEHLND